MSALPPTDFVSDLRISKHVTNPQILGPTGKHLSRCTDHPSQPINRSFSLSGLSVRHSVLAALPRRPTLPHQGSQLSPDRQGSQPPLRRSLLAPSQACCQGLPPSPCSSESLLTAPSSPQRFPFPMLTGFARCYGVRVDHGQVQPLRLPGQPATQWHPQTRPTTTAAAAAATVAVISDDALDR